MTPEQLPLFRRTIASGWTEDETQLYLLTCERTQLEPFARYLYVARDRRDFRIESTIDGFRLAAERTGKYAGQIGPHWCGSDGVWKAIWTAKEPPTAARVGILRSDFSKPVWGKALYSEFVQQSEFWRNMAANQLAKCAEASGFRKAFPVLSGLYTSDELCRGAAAVSNQPSPLAGDDPAPVSASNPALHFVPVASPPCDAEHGGAQTLAGVPAVPLPLQPFIDAGMSRKNVQAAFSFLQAEMEKALGEEGTKTFRRLWLQLPRIFKTREEAKAQTIACWVRMWAHIERAKQRPEAA